MLTTAVVLQAEEFSANEEARVIFETDLRQRPKEDSRVKGRLPDGSVVILVGKQRGDYQMVEVELEDGTSLDGWVNMNALQRMGGTGAPGGAPDPQKPRRRSRTRMVLPEDESLLLRRKPSFFFGVNLGGNFAVIQPAQPVNPGTYTGVGFIAGGYAGFYLQDNVPLRLEVNYLQMNGSDPNIASTADPSLADSLNYGFLEFAVVPALTFNTLEVFAGLGFALGISIGDTPNGFQPNPGEEINAASDISSLSAQVGAGVTFDLNRDTQMAVRGRYTIHIDTSPILFMGFGVVASLQLRG
ncbi:MAG: outer membrane beta-barrel protein [Bdellovibrionales bacterium]|nr:outer membrane beta-barrel protein [Bdellovibrionales bacterium]